MISFPSETWYCWFPYILRFIKNDLRSEKQYQHNLINPWLEQSQCLSNKWHHWDMRRFTTYILTRLPLSLKNCFAILSFVEYLDYFAPKYTPFFIQILFKTHSYKLQAVTNVSSSMPQQGPCRNTPFFSQLHEYTNLRLKCR